MISQANVGRGLFKNAYACRNTRPRVRSRECKPQHTIWARSISEYNSAAPALVASDDKMKAQEKEQGGLDWTLAWLIQNMGAYLLQSHRLSWSKAVFR